MEYIFAPLHMEVSFYLPFYLKYTGKDERMMIEAYTAQVRLRYGGGTAQVGRN